MVCACTATPGVWLWDCAAAHIAQPALPACLRNQALVYNPVVHTDLAMLCMQGGSYGTAEEAFLVRQAAGGLRVDDI